MVLPEWDLVLAGALAVPPLLVLAGSLPVLLVLSAPAAYLLLARHRKVEEKDDKEEGGPTYHVVVTGGSSGIGLGVAKRAASKWSSAANKKLNKYPIVRKVTLLARNPTKLESARAQVQSLDDSIDVQVVPVDVTDPDALRKAADNVFSSDGKPTSSKKKDDGNKSSPTNKDRVLLFCCAGESHPQYFDQLRPDVFLKQVLVNQLGCTYAAHAFLPHMVVRGGTLCFCSSAAGQVGVFGLAAYSPTKFALRGLAESLHSELLDTGVHVQVAFPPDTDTPGFERENQTKPEECHLVSSTAGLADPDDVGKVLFDSAAQNRPPFQVYFGFDGWLLSSLTCGFSPATTFLDSWVQLSGLPTLGRWIALFYLRLWHDIIRDCRRRRERSSHPESGSSDAEAKDAKEPKEGTEVPDQAEPEGKLTEPKSE